MRDKDMVIIAQNDNRNIGIKSFSVANKSLEQCVINTSNVVRLLPIFNDQSPSTASQALHEAGLIHLADPPAEGLEGSRAGDCPA
jgi:hypothetical protein